MKNKHSFTEFVIVLFIVTACITILEGILGLIFMPDLLLGFDAFFVPPIFGFFSALTGIITHSSKELSIKQMLFREFLQLMLIEIMVFGTNYFASRTFFETKLTIALAIGIAIIFVTVYFVMWLNDRQSARLFNEKLKAFQRQIQKVLKFLFQPDNPQKALHIPFI